MRAANLKSDMVKLLLILRVFLFILTLSALTVGCGRVTQSKPVSRLEKIVRSDKFLVAESALHYMLDKYSGYGTNRDYYSAYEVDGGNFTAQLVSDFAGYKPVVRSDIQVSMDSGEARDSATGKRVKLWRVAVEEIHDDRAEAHVSWYVAPEGAAGYTIRLQRRNGGWIVESEVMNWVS
jgi:hypothetical protein